MREEFVCQRALCTREPFGSAVLANTMQLNKYVFNLGLNSEAMSEAHKRNALSNLGPGFELVFSASCDDIKCLILATDLR